MTSQVTDPNTLIAEDADVKRATERHAKAATKLRSAVERIASKRAEVATLTAERSMLSEQILDENVGAIRKSRQLDERIDDLTAEIRAFTRALPSAEELVRVAAKEYAGAYAKAATAASAKYFADANDLVPTAREQQREFDATQARIKSLRACAEAVAMFAQREHGVTRILGTPSDVRSQVLAPVAGVALQTARLIELLEPFEALARHGDFVEVEFADLNKSPRVLPLWRRVTLAALPEALAAALGESLVAQRDARRVELDTIKRDNGELQREADYRNAANIAEWERKYGPMPKASK